MKNPILEIAISLLGLYFMAMFVQFLPFGLLALSTSEVELTSDRSTHVLSSLMAPLIYLIISLALLIKRSQIAQLLSPNLPFATNESPKKAGPHTKLSFWIVLLGLYFALNSLMHLLRDAASIALQKPGLLVSEYSIGNVLLLFVSLACIFRANAIARFIEKKGDIDI